MNLETTKKVAMADALFGGVAMSGELQSPAPGLVMRPLETSDLDKGFVALLAQARRSRSRRLVEFCSCLYAAQSAS